MIITVLNSKGGVGKSVTALHLAGIFSETKSTVLVDLDDENASCLDYAAGGNLAFPVGTAQDYDDDLQHQLFEITIVDAYARPTRDQLASMASMSNLLVIPTPPDATSLRVLARSIAQIEETGTPYKVLLTMVPPRPSSEADKARRDLKAGSIPTFRTQIARSVGFSRAARQKRLAYELPGYKHLRESFLSLRKEIQNAAKKK